MAHITGLSLGNFKVFKETTHFEFAPITILTGGNNVGKSSVLKALLLIADNAKKTQFLELDFSGDKHNLDTFDYTLNKRADSEVIEIGFELSQLYELYLPDSKRGGRFDFRYGKDYPSNSKLLLKYIKNKNGGKLVEYKIECEDDTILLVKYDLEKHHSIYVNLKWLVEKANIKPINLTEYGISVINQVFEDFNENERLKLRKTLENEFLNHLSTIIIDKENWYKSKEDIFSEPNPINEYENANYNTIIEYFFLSGTLGQFSLNEDDIFSKKISVLLNNTEFDAYKNRLSDFEINDFYPIREHDIPHSFYKFINNGYEIISKNIKVDYIANFRANSKRLYSNQHQGTDFNELLLEIHKTKFKKENKQFIQDWLKAFGIGDDIHFTWFKGVATEVKIEKNGNLIDLVDLGFGFTQIIPIILKIALITNLDEWDFENQFKESLEFIFRRNELVLLEEPETNLHPNFQSKLADFLLDASKRFNIQFIIETHSEYLIRRLQYLVATKETYPKDIALYYFNDPENIPQGEEQVKKIEFLENGKLSDHFGMGFFDEANNLAIDLFKLNRERSRAKV